MNSAVRPGFKATQNSSQLSLIFIGQHLTQFREEKCIDHRCTEGSKLGSRDFCPQSCESSPAPIYFIPRIYRNQTAVTRVRNSAICKIAPHEGLQESRRSMHDLRRRQGSQLLTRSTYSPVRVSTLITLPTLMKPGTINSASVSSLAGLVTLVAVSPLAPGAQSTTSSST